MNLRILSPPSWSISINLAKWASKLGIPLASTQPIKGIIIVGNGIPDDIICLILAHKFNGKHIMGITKPQKLGIDSIHPALELIKDEKIKNLMLIIDQEENKLSELWEKIEERFKEKGMKCKIIKKEERLHIYECFYNDYKFNALIILNGLDKPYLKHTIEDHLLEFSKELNKEIILDKNINPKEIWRKLKDKHQDIYSNLLKYGKEKIELFFPQHVKAFNFLKQIFENSRSLKIN
jgi:hypothetical protein